MEIKNFVFNSFMVNAYVLYDDTHEAVIVDGAVSTAAEQDELADFIAANNLKIKYIVNTHGHVDHVCGNSFLKQRYNVPILMNFADADLAANTPLGEDVVDVPAPDVDIKDGDVIDFGHSQLTVLATPGHSAGSVSLYSAEDYLVISGDTLLSESVGRTNLPGGCYNTLLGSIRGKLLALSDDTDVYPGHGPETTIGHERRYNLYLYL